MKAMSLIDVFIVAGSSFLLLSLLGIFLYRENLAKRILLANVEFKKRSYSASEKQVIIRWGGWVLVFTVGAFMSLLGLIMIKTTPSEITQNWVVNSNLALFAVVATLLLWNVSLVKLFGAFKVKPDATKVGSQIK